MSSSHTPKIVTAITSLSIDPAWTGAGLTMPGTLSFTDAAAALGPALKAGSATPVAVVTTITAERGITDAGTQGVIDMTDSTVAKTAPGAVVPQSWVIHDTADAALDVIAGTAMLTVHGGRGTIASGSGGGFLSANDSAGGETVLISAGAGNTTLSGNRETAGIHFQASASRTTIYTGYGMDTIEASGARSTTTVLLTRDGAPVPVSMHVSDTSFNLGNWSAGKGQIHLALGQSVVSAAQGGNATYHLSDGATVVVYGGHVADQSALFTNG